MIAIKFVIGVLLFAFIGAGALLADQRLPDEVRDLQSEIINNGSSYSDLYELTRDYGPRLTGSENSARAVEWAVSKMNRYQFDRVWKQPVTVPKWVRGTTEHAEIVGVGQPVKLEIAALGRSAGTSGIDAEVIEVKSLDEVRALGERVRGKIVFYNRPMDPTLENTFLAYSQAVDQRGSGPSVASKLGAVAVLVRSMTTLTDDHHPHTGGTYFPAGVTPIPAAALSTYSANVLSRSIADQPSLHVRIELSAQTLPDVTSYNVVGEITGSQQPSEIVLVGGHLDSWDLGQGAHDDGAGVVQTLDTCRAVKALKYKPKRTIRCVLFMTEELGGIGANEYARQAEINHEHYVMAIESDRGGFAPEKFSVDGTPEQVSQLNQQLSLFSPMGIQSFYKGGAGTDVEPLAALGALTMDLAPNSKHYFDFHHAATDQFSAVNEGDLKRGAAAMASLVYYFSERE